MQIVLVHPEIPQNTGNIARTCAATGAVLHLVEPLGFELKDKYLKRAGLDYWHLMKYFVWPSWEEFLGANPGGRFFLATRKAEKSYAEEQYQDGDYLVFGCESRGLDHGILAAFEKHCIRIPMVPEARSLNLSNSVAVVLYEALRQQGYPGLLSSGSMAHEGAPWEDYL